MLVGVHGKLRSGKDAVARHLVKEYGFVRLAFADKLREIAGELFGVVIRHSEGKDYPPKVRKLLQDIGLAMRKIDPDVLVNYVTRQADPMLTQGISIVITDVRFVNEAEAIMARRGQLWKIIRTTDEAGRPIKRTGNVHKHPSETSLDGWEFAENKIIYNDDTLKELYEDVDIVLQGLLPLSKPMH